MASPAQANQGVLQVLEPGTAQSLAVTGVSAASAAAVAATTNVVRLCGDVDMHLKFGVAPTATAGSDLRLTAKIPEYLKIAGGAKVAAIKASGAADGTLQITEMI